MKKVKSLKDRHRDRLWQDVDNAIWFYHGDHKTWAFLAYDSSLRDFVVEVAFAPAIRFGPYTAIAKGGGT